ncbi:hypothetical protein VHEMI06864 [[Torrubiella] hemipterigena]|uniref:Uncharacterized protein n=1 Tax=[Torrubiella] hemipterigena TaxID=1531966 RepID=A0A0A1T1T5_9HYPO|nr:hypothetical protein VHEMI06864 [[Torrubiella] hemipterigena]
MLLAAPPLIPENVALPLEQVNTMKDVQLLLGILPKILANAVPDDHWSIRASMRTTTAMYIAVLPSRAGENVALDAAIQCLAGTARSYYTKAILLRSNEREALEDPRVMLRHHSNSLNCLRQAIHDPVQAVAVETLCATALLSCFESFFSDGTDENQLHHQNGIEELMKHRQTHRFTTSFDLDLVEGQAGYIVRSHFDSILRKGDQKNNKTD